MKRKKFDKKDYTGVIKSTSITLRINMRSQKHDVTFLTM